MVMFTFRLGELESYMQRLLSEGQPLKVLHLGRGVLARYPRHLATYSLLMEASLDAQYWEDVCDIAERLLTADPLASKAWWAIAAASQAMSGATGALQAWRRAFDFAPYAETARSAMRVYLKLTSHQVLLPTPVGRAHLYLRARRWRDACVAYESLDSRQRRSRYDVWAGYCLALWQSGERERAVKVAVDLVADYAENWQANLVLAAHGGELGAAAEERLRMLDPEGTRSRMTMGRHTPLSLQHVQVRMAETNYVRNQRRAFLVEQTFVILKPDAVQRGLIGEIISRFEQRGFKILAMKFQHVSTELAREHYAVHEGKPFYEPLIEYITSGPVVAMILEGKNAIEAARRTVGATNPTEAAPGTIRGDFGLEIGRNLVHASDGPETAATEIALWFGDDVSGYPRDLDRWIRE